MEYGTCNVKKLQAEIERAAGRDLNDLLSLLKVDVDLDRYRLVKARRDELFRILRVQPNYVRLALVLYNRSGDDQLAALSAVLPKDWSTQFPPVSALADLEHTGGVFKLRARKASPPKGTPSKGGAKSSRRRAKDAPQRDERSRRSALALTEMSAPDAAPQGAATGRGPSGEAGDPAAAVAALTAQLQTAMHAISDLQRSRQELEDDFDTRAQEGARQLFTAAARGRDDVPVVPSKLTAQQLSRVTAYDLDPSFMVGSWERGESWSPNVLMSPTSKTAKPSRGALRNVLFNCRMRKEDRLRLLGQIAKPTVWSNPPGLKPSDEELLGVGGVAADGKLAASQVRHLERAQPIVASLNTLSQALSCLPDNDRDEVDRVGLHGHLRELLEQLSDSLHLVAYDVSDLHRQRRKLLASAVGGTAVDIDLSSDEEDWDLGDSDLYGKAKAARDVACGLQRLHPNKTGRRPQPRDTKTGSQANTGGGKPRTAEQQKKLAAKRKAYKQRKAGKTAGGNGGGGTAAAAKTAAAAAPTGAPPAPAGGKSAAAKKKKK